MTTITTTGKTIEGNYIGASLRSCGKVDQPTKQRITVTIDGTEYDRAIYERIVWRNSTNSDVIARFVIVNGINYEVVEADVWHSVGNLGEMQDGCGNSLVYGEFGGGTYGLHTSIDGRKVCLRTRSREDATLTLYNIANGWRPTNWKTTTN